MSRSRLIASDGYTFTALMVGYYATGKSALLSRFSRNTFDEEYRMTLNSCQGTRLFSLEGHKAVRLNLVDTLGNGFGKQMVTNSLPESDAILLVYDITNQQSFYRLDKWLNENRRVVRRHVLLALVGTHLDQPYKRKVNPEEAMRWKKKHAIDMIFQVSAKTNQNVPELFHEINKHLLYGKQQAPDTAYLDMNPEVSAILEDRDTHQNYRLALLQKKLQFKQMECDKLWTDYEEALRRISELQSGRTERSDGSNLLSSFKDYQTDAEQVDGKMRFREDNIKVLEQFYNQRQEALEEATAKKIQNLQRRIDELESQLDESQKLEKQKGMEIRDLLASRDDLRTKMGGLQYDYSEKVAELDRLSNQVSTLVRELNEKTSLLDLDEAECVSKYKIAAVAYLDGKIKFLLNQLEELNSLTMTLNYQLKVAKERHQLEVQALTEHLNRLLNLNQEYSHQIQAYQSQLKWYRIQSILKEAFEKEIQQLHQKIAEMEQEFDLKCEEYIEIIEQKEKALKLLLEHSKDQTDKLEAVTRQNERLFEENTQKDRLLQNKTEILEKIFGEKQNEINQLRGFIEELGKNSSNLVQKYSKMQNKGQGSHELLIFCTHFFQKFQEKSAAMVDNFQDIEGKIQTIATDLSQLQEKVQMLTENNEPISGAEYLKLQQRRDQLSKMRQIAGKVNLVQSYNELLNQIPVWEAHLLQTVAPWSSEVQNVSLGLSLLSEQLQEISQAFEGNLAQISENMKTIEAINELGVEQYVSQYFN